jgi:uncharacterized protein (DUF302 family)
VKSSAISVDLAFPAAEQAVREALSAEGFGVLSEIDVAATLKQKLGVERAPLKILGACNPALAHRALDLDPAAALVLPCNVVLSEEGPRRTRVAIADPTELLPSKKLARTAAEASLRLQTVMARLGTANDGLATKSAELSVSQG